MNKRYIVHAADDILTVLYSSDSLDAAYEEYLCRASHFELVSLTDTQLGNLLATSQL